MADLRPNNINGLSAAEREKVLADMITNPSPQAGVSSMQNPLGMFPQPMQQEAAPVVQSNPKKYLPQKSHLEQFNDLFKSTDEDLGNEESMLTKLKGDIERFEKGDGRMDLTPLAAFADTFTGSKISSMVTKPLTKQEREATAIKLNSDLLERLQKVRGEKERRMEDIKLKLMGMDNQRDMTMAKLEENALYREGLRAAQKDKEDAKNEKKNLELEIPGVGLAKTKQDADKGKAANELFQKLQSNTAEMKKLRKENGGGEFLNRDAVERGKSLQVDSAAIVKDLWKLGALTGPDLGFIDKIVPKDPLAFDSGSLSLGILGDPTMTKLDELETKSKRDFHAFLKTHGVGTEADRFKVTGLTDNLKTPEQEKADLLKQKQGN